MSAQEVTDDVLKKDKPNLKIFVNIQFIIQQQKTWDAIII